MAAFNLFKKKETVTKETPLEQKGVPDIAEEKKEEPEKAVISAKKSKKDDITVPTLIGPHVTEKASMLMEENKYTFKVYNQATKGQIKQAVEGIYGVDVENIRVLRIPEKTIRVGKREGIKKGYKKAIVKVKKGQEIDLLPR